MTSPLPFTTHCSIFRTPALPYFFPNNVQRNAPGGGEGETLGVSEGHCSFAIIEILATWLNLVDNVKIKAIADFYEV